MPQRYEFGAVIKAKLIHPIAKVLISQNKKKFHASLQSSTSVVLRLCDTTNTLIGIKTYGHLNTWKLGDVNAVDIIIIDCFYACLKDSIQ